MAKSWRGAHARAREQDYVVRHHTRAGARSAVLQIIGNFLTGVVTLGWIYSGSDTDTSSAWIADGARRGRAYVGMPVT